jgi:hypothetical protein
MANVNSTEASSGLFPLRVSAASTRHCSDDNARRFDADAHSPRAASKVDVFFKVISPPDEEKGSDTAIWHPASPWVVASAVDTIMLGSCVSEGGWLLIWECMGVGVSVCVCVYVAPSVCVCEWLGGGTGARPGLRHTSQPVRSHSRPGRAVGASSGDSRSNNGNPLVTGAGAVS